MTKRKQIAVYVDENITKFLDGKVEDGFKISSWIRFLILKEMKGEQSKKGV